jgi:hypothetical protein
MLSGASGLGLCVGKEKRKLELRKASLLEEPWTAFSWCGQLTLGGLLACIGVHKN